MVLYSPLRSADLSLRLLSFQMWAHHFLPYTHIQTQTQMSQNRTFQKSDCLKFYNLFHFFFFPIFFPLPPFLLPHLRRSGNSTADTMQNKLPGFRSFGLPVQSEASLACSHRSRTPGHLTSSFCVLSISSLSHVQEMQLSGVTHVLSCNLQFLPAGWILVLWMMEPFLKLSLPIPFLFCFLLFFFFNGVSDACFVKGFTVSAVIQEQSF